MSLASYLRPEAEKDLELAARWYEQQQLGLGSEFLDEVLKAITQIEEHPLLYAKVHKDVRRALLSRFPFSMYYVVEPDAAAIVGIMHSSRHPRRWMERTYK